MGNRKGNVHPNWAASVRSTPEVQEKKRQTFYATRAAWIQQGRPRMLRRVTRTRGMPTTRAEAIAKGKRYYFTGQPCHRGHIAIRRVRGAHCLECRREENALPNDRVAKMPPLVEPATRILDQSYRSIVI